MAKGDSLGALEELVLLAVLKAGDDAYGLAVQRFLRDAGRKLELPTIYTTLERMEDKGLLSSQLEGATPIRGGRAKRVFSVEAHGMRALHDAASARKQLDSLAAAQVTG
jgi:PadR family transcriptional regulator, regulatory protein PadR